MTNKHQKLFELAQKRQTTSRAGFLNLRDFHAGFYECPFVSPWSISACNIESSIMIVGEDWIGADTLAGPKRTDVAKLGYDPQFPTNINLFGLLGRHFQVQFSDVYATNLFPLIKPGNSSASISAGDLDWATSDFLVPQIEALSPKLIICLGVTVVRRRRKCAHLPMGANLQGLIEDPFDFLGARIEVVAHTGALGMNGRGRQQVEKDWQQLSMRCRHLI